MSDPAPDPGATGDDGPEATGPDATTGRGDFYRAAWVFYLVLAIAAVLWIGIRRGPLPLALFVDRKTWPLDLTVGLAAGLLGVAVWRLGRRVPTLAELETRLKAMLTGLGRDEALALAVLSGFAEELFFRGAMQDAWGPVWATLVFGLLHSGRGRALRAWTLFAVVAGAGLAALTVWRGNLLPAIVAHILINAINLRSLVAERPTPAA